MRREITQPTEEQEQVAVFEWISYNLNKYPELRFCLHIPNGGLRSKSEAVRFKRAGVKKGVPDILLPVARKGYHGLWIEMKRQKGGHLSSEQKEWLDGLFQQGYLAVRCDGADEAIGMLERYLKP